MEWNVKNAVNRDVERQQLNKILAEIRASVVSGRALTEDDVRRIAGTVVSGNTQSPITVTLEGDVKGKGTGRTAIKINAELTGDYVEDTPNDALPYWRMYKQWYRVPDALLALAEPETEGILVYDSSYGVYKNVEIEGTDGRIVVLNGAGLLGNPSIDLAEVEDGGVAPSLLKVTRDAYGRVDNTEQATADDVPIATIGNATWDNVQDAVNVLNSPGVISGGGFTAGAGGVLTYAPMSVAIRSTDDDVSTLYMADIPGGTVTVPNDSVSRYVGVVYNGGDPTVVIREANNWDLDTEFPLGEVANLGGTLYPLYNPYKVGDPITNIIQRFDAQAFAIRSSAGGLELSTDGVTRNLGLTAGHVWTRLNDHAISAKDSTTSPLIRVTPTGTTPPLAFTSGITQWPNDQYISGNTLTTMGNNKWAVLWVFVSIGSGAWGFAHGTAEYNNSSAAATDSVPSYLTAAFLRQNILVGRLIFQKGSTTPIVESAFSRVFSTQAVSDHNQLGGLQGGTVGEYFHLTQEELDKINAAVVPSSTPTDGDILEYDATISSWVPKKDPTELLIDGGNF